MSVDAAGRPRKRQRGFGSRGRQQGVPTIDGSLNWDMHQIATCFDVTPGTAKWIKRECDAQHISPGEFLRRLVADAYIESKL